MNNIVNMVNYYLIHKNADDSIIEYLKNKIDNSTTIDLIIIEIELLYTDPSDKLVSELVSYINDKLNIDLTQSNITILSNIVYKLNKIKCSIETKINKLDNDNKELFDKIKSKDLNNDSVIDDLDSEIAANLINDIENNKFTINKCISEISSINIWINNINNSIIKKINKLDLETLFNSYINLLSYLNQDSNIDNYINLIRDNIDNKLLNNNIIDTITNIIPELDRLYNYKSNKELYKLLDYYIDIVDDNIKLKLNRLGYEERLLLKEKLNVIVYDILHNDTDEDDFKALIINSYINIL